jgi:predicted GH43/DUF377 family glycosyl hydrolase
MSAAKRSPHNPILIPDSSSPWQAEAVFNPSPVIYGGKTHLLFRATGPKRTIEGREVEVSVIGHVAGDAPADFGGPRNKLVVPEFPWERFGCEDPRATAFEGKCYIFYTAVSEFSADGIKVAVAVTSDFTTVEEKHLVTPFNAKAMALFPERVNGKIAALLTVDTDRPPSRVCLALFDRAEDMWSEAYWKEWYAHLDDHAIGIERNEHDHVEVGSPPLKTEEGWLFFYSYIYNYFSPPPTFGVQAALLDHDDPRMIVGEVKRPLMVPREEYEIYGRVPHIVFPSGALMRGEDIDLYYGAADTVSCVASFKKEGLIAALKAVAARQLHRYAGNPIITPLSSHGWESKAAFNPAALYEEGRVHILYRAMANDNTSVFGYASSRDGVTIDERLPEPVYVPREDFEKKKMPGGNSGCEDPRLTCMGDTIYMCYTAYDGTDPPRVALSSIARKDFLAHRWTWSPPKLISPAGKDDKDTALFSKKIGRRYAFLHRLGNEIWIDYKEDLSFDGGEVLGGKVLMRPRDTAWDSRRIGITGPPVFTRYGWLLLYHGVSRRAGHYSVRAALLDARDPEKVLYRTQDPIFEPKMPYERNGIVPNVVFPCGVVAIKDTLFVYYGGADTVTGVATVSIDTLVEGMVEEEGKGEYSAA